MSSTTASWSTTQRCGTRSRNGAGSRLTLRSLPGSPRWHSREEEASRNSRPASMELCEGIVACAIALPRLGKLVLFSNNGSLYIGNKPQGDVFASESYPLDLIGCRGRPPGRNRLILDIPVTAEDPVSDWRAGRPIWCRPWCSRAVRNTSFSTRSLNSKRCTRCILPETMTFIRFDAEGVCNYCRNYKPRNIPRPKEELYNLVEPYRRAAGPSASSRSRVAGTVAMHCTSSSMN